MDLLGEWGLSPDMLKVLVIPWVAAAIGWVTNWLAVWMTFNPLNYVGFRPLHLGWQGIIPSKARRMAGIAVQSILSKLITLREIIDTLEPRRIGAHIVRQVDPLLETWVDETMAQHYPVVWANLPQAVRRQVVAQVRRRLPHRMDELIADVRLNVDHLMDITPVVEDHLERNPALLNRIFLECGEREFHFLVRSGAYFGFSFGCLQALLWLLLPWGWTLVIAGVLVGWATNWIALNLIFRPLHPHRVGPFVIQGLFLKRQDEVSESFCRIVIREVVTLPRLVDALLNGPRHDRSRSLLRHHVKPLVDEVAGTLGVLPKLALQAVLGPVSFARIKESVADKAELEAPLPFEDEAFVRERGERLQALVQARMRHLPPEDFQDLLRPCFKEDEKKLILVGAILGGCAGLGQWLLLFA